MFVRRGNWAKQPSPLQPEFCPVASQAPVEDSFFSRTMTFVKGGPSPLPVTLAGGAGALLPLGCLQGSPGVGCTAPRVLLPP